MERGYLVAHIRFGIYMGEDTSGSKKIIYIDKNSTKSITNTAMVEFYVGKDQGHFRMVDETSIEFLKEEK